MLISNAVKFLAQAANIAPVEAMEQEDGTDAAHAKNEDDGEGKAAAFKGRPIWREGKNLDAQLYP